MRVLVLTDNFVPEQNAPALREYEHCRRWVAQGIDVTVITTVPNFPLGKPQAPYKNKLYQRETIGGIDVIRVWTFLAPNRGVVLRSLDFVSFAVTGFLLAGIWQRADVILATSPQLLTGLLGHVLAKLKRTPWVFEVRDLWPDSIVAVGAMREGGMIRFLRKVEHMLYRSANRVVALNAPTRERIASGGIPIDKIGIVSNGADISRIKPRAKEASLLAEHKLQGKFVVGYVGTHGMAQGLEVIVHAADLMRNDSSVHFIMVGPGAERRRIIALAQKLKLENITFVDMVPSDTAMDYLSVCDAVVAPLKKSPLIDLSVPSKIFEAAAMERPTILCAHGLAADLLTTYGAGIAIEPEDPQALADTVKKLRDDPVLMARLKAGSAALARDYDRENLAAQMLEELKLAAAAR
jgi:glycosyltransferase involved in cell wall biosynthesis